MIIPSICPVCSNQDLNANNDFKGFECNICGYVYQVFNNGDYFWNFYLEHISVSLINYYYLPNQFSVHITDRITGISKALTCPMFEIDLNNYINLMKKIKMLCLFQ